MASFESDKRGKRGNYSIGGQFRQPLDISGGVFPDFVRGQWDCDGGFYTVGQTGDLGLLAGQQKHFAHLNRRQRIPFDEGL